jgi:hypothetical protein
MIDKLSEIEQLIGDELASASAEYLAAPFATEARGSSDACVAH